MTFHVNKGEFCIIVGPFGRRQDHPAEYAGRDGPLRRGPHRAGWAEVSRFDEKELTAYRRYDVGFVFQFYNLVQTSPR